MSTQTTLPMSDATLTHPNEILLQDPSRPRETERRLPKVPTSIALRQQRGRIRWVTLIAIAAIHVLALLAFLPMFFTWTAVLTAVVLQFVCGLGVTVGYHRLLTHKSFRTPKPVEYLLSWLGSLSLQGGPIQWVATHRLHHQHSDDEGDPHSPRHGFFWAHAIWCFVFDPEFDPYEKYSRYAKDLARDPVHRWIERLTVVSNIAVGLLLFAIGGWPLLFWGLFVRLVFVYHTTWLVNSATHKWGYRNFETSDDSRNLWWVAALALGEGWHNNHHAHPNSARHGLRKGEFDISWLVIRGLKLLGLARDIRTAPAPAADV